jgi:hypothetical protein
MMETGKGINGHVTTLGNTIFYVEMDDLQAYLDKAASLSGKTLVPPVPIPTGTLAWMRMPKQTRSASGNPLPTECKNVAILECGSLHPPLQRRACLACSFPILRRRQSRIRIRAAQAARSKMPAAPMPPPTHMVTNP